MIRVTVSEEDTLCSEDGDRVSLARVMRTGEFFTAVPNHLEPIASASEIMNEATGCDWNTCSEICRGYIVFSFYAKTYPRYCHCPVNDATRNRIKTDLAYLILEARNEGVLDGDFK
jgi:hypothetical protein